MKISISETVVLNADEVATIPIPSYLVRGAAGSRNVGGRLTYFYDLTKNEWIFDAGSVHVQKLKKDGTPYNAGPIANRLYSGSRYPEETALIEKYFPTKFVTVEVSE